jgi:hypothetical protein
VTYADTQSAFNAPPTYVETPTWKVMSDAIQAGVMPPPSSGVSLLPAQRTTLLAWFAEHAPPAAAGTGCP